MATWLKLSLAVTSKRRLPSSSSSLRFWRGSRTHDTVGGVLSMFTGGDVNVALFPARSVTVMLCVTPLPSVVRTSGLDGVVAASPERLSAAANAIETLPLFQPAAFVEGVGKAKVTIGDVLSIWTGKVFGASALFALSRAK